ncbi:MAG: GIY-YIG nuclease family protein [Calditrichia bacterium]|nr:GIY-YIG nuclease family protein [Calditrichia bacterium]
MDKYFFYILYSSKIDQYYIGSSHDPATRLTYHNKSIKGWTRRGRPWILAFKKPFDTKKEAQFWERKIKKQKRKDIIEIIIRNEFLWIK